MEHNMKKDVVITIKGIAKTSGKPDVIELTTIGNLVKKSSGYYLTYKESEATGFAGSTTTLKVEGNDRVTILRNGKNASQLIVEKGKRHLCCYGSDYGNMTMGIFGEKIDSTINDDGGDLHVKYTLDVNTSLASENEILINVKECNK